MAALSLAIGLAAALAVPPSLAAQWRSAPRFAAAAFPSDTPAAATALAAGQAAADKASVARRWVGGIAAGVPAGLVGLPLAYYGATNGPGMSAAMGLGIVAGSALLVGVTAVAGTAEPQGPVAGAARGRGAEYEAEFREGYADRLWSRRGAAAFGGGLIGAATGLVVFNFIRSGIAEMN